MRLIDRQSWPRRQHFALFNTLVYPYLNISANVDITTFYPRVKECNLSFTVALVYLLARVANGIPEFRCRIRGEEVVEHDVTHPSITVLDENDLFGFCTIPYTEQFDLFVTGATAAINHAKKHISLETEFGQDNLLYMTSIPWLSFTHIMHPVPLYPPDSAPRIAWGKFFPEGDSLKMPLAVQVNHALADGVHIGHYFAQVQQLLDQLSLDG